MDLISVIVPVYNVEKYIDKCVESIVNQTYKNLEIILVDDGSTDGSSTKCDAWAKKDGRIRAIHKENGGVSSARNAGLDMAHGAFVSFVDSDDYIDENMMHLFHSSMRKDIIQFVSCNYYCVDESSNLSAVKRNAITISGMQNIIKSYLNEEICPPCIGAKFYRMEIIKQNNLRFDLDVSVGEDFLFNYFYLKHCNCALAISNVLYYYYRGRNTAATTCTNSNLISRWKNTKKILQLEQSSSLFSVCLQKYATELLSIVRELLRSKNQQLICRHYRELTDEIDVYFRKFLQLKALSFFHKAIICWLHFSPNSFRKIYTKYLLLK